MSYYGGVLYVLIWIESKILKGEYKNFMDDCKYFQGKLLAFRNRFWNLQGSLKANTSKNMEWLNYPQYLLKKVEILPELL